MTSRSWSYSYLFRLPLGISTMQSKESGAMRQSVSRCQEQGGPGARAPGCSLLEDLLGHRERRIRRRHAAVDRALEQHLFELILLEAVAQGRAHMHAQLLEAAGRDQRGERDGAASAAVEARSRPDLAPRVAGDQVLEVGRELRLACLRGVHVLVAEHLTAHLHAALVRLSHRLSS